LTTVTQFPFCFANPATKWYKFCNTLEEIHIKNYATQKNYITMLPHKYSLC
jgi:hypothetical protein